MHRILLLVSFGIVSFGFVACSKPNLEADRSGVVAAAPGGTASTHTPLVDKMHVDRESMQNDALPEAGVCAEAVCPLYHWMKKNASKAMREEKADPLEAVFAQIANMAPDAGFPHWGSISRDGARAARAGQYDAAKAACRGCHDQYKDKYKKELRARGL